MIYRTGLTLMLLAACAWCLTLVAASSASQPSNAPQVTMAAHQP